MLHSAATITPHRVAGMLIISTCGRLTGCVDLPRKATIDTTATDTGEAAMPICEATEATAIGRSGRTPSLMAMS